MRPLRWIGNAIAGRYRHWNAENNRTFTLLWEATDAVPSPADEILRKFLVSSMSLCHSLLGPDSADPLLKVDILSLEADDFRSIHAVQVATLAGLFTSINPRFSEDLERGLLTIFPDEQVSARIFRQVTTTGEPDLASVAGVVWKEFLTITNAPDRPFEGPFAYAMLLGAAAKGAFADIRAQL